LPIIQKKYSLEYMSSYYASPYLLRPKNFKLTSCVKLIKKCFNAFQKLKENKLLKSDDLLKRRPQLHDLLLRFWSSKGLFAIIHYQFQSVLDSQVLCTSEFGPFLQFLKIFVFLSSLSALKAHNQLAWLQLQELSVSYFCAIMLLLPQYHQLWCVRSADFKQKRLLLYYYLMYHYWVNSDWQK